MTMFAMPGLGRERGGVMAPDMSAFSQMSDLISPQPYSLRRRESYSPIGRESVRLGSLLKMGTILAFVTTVAVIAIKQRMSG